MHKLLIFCSLLAAVAAYSSGAPKSDEICSGLRPNHPGDPQAGKLPYKMRVDKRSVKGGETVTFSIRSPPNKMFKGFLVQGRRVEGDTETPVGAWVGEEPDSQTLNCGDIDNSAITHRSGDGKGRISLKWVTPKEKGTYVFLTTVVESGKVYWVGHKSSNITVV